MVAGVAGAIAGLVVRRGFGDEGVLLGSVTALVGALPFAFGTRVRLSAAIARANL